ncbi:MAG: (Fe-S)-binding protein [bacterium]
MLALGDLETRLSQLTPEDLERGLAAFRSHLRSADVAALQTCVRCGLCAESCHYYRADGEIESTPAHKLGLVASVYRRHFTPAGRILPALVGARPFDSSMARAWIEAVWGRCSTCGRCSLNCTTGIHVAAVLRAARAALTEIGLVPADLQAVVATSLRSGNNMGITREDWLDTVQWIEEELQQATGDPAARIPVDEAGARVLFTVNPREPKFYPLSLLASATVFHAAGEDWTVASEGWDLTNYGLFTASRRDGGAIAEALLRSAERLGCRVLVIGECGHGFAAARWEAAEWLGRRHGVEIRSVLELMEDYFREGRLSVDPDRHPEAVTLHDPCNLVRMGGIVEPQRSILRRAARNFVEMTPNRAENFCCGGGGGQLSMSAFRAKRVQAGGIKAEQIRRTGAKTVVAPCHNCIDQLMELDREYELGVSVKTVAEMVADALVPRPTT